tara:strand:+ start:378 stop:485 length:108 start_codon:yes stop_codon:yes gene_type:complete
MSGKSLIIRSQNVTFNGIDGDWVEKESADTPPADR